jgi:EAL domain-containing protein (putative c-di-GMP-specific phosphodiesterase class I)
VPNSHDRAGHSATQDLPSQRESVPLDTPFELDELVLIAAALTDASTVQVVLSESGRLRCHAQMGLVSFEISLESAFYRSTIGAHDCFVVADALEDPRFATDELVLSGPRVRFFTGVALRTRAGQCLGALCLFGGLPRQLSAERCEALTLVARKLSESIEARRALSPGQRPDAARQQMMRELRRATEGGDFELHYQPKVDLRGNRIVGFEALLRWNSEVFGSISPSSFVPLLEESGLILPVGSWVIEQAIADYRHWISLGLDVPAIAVNVSPIQLADEGFVHEFEKVMSGSGALRSPLDVEITEGTLLDNTASTIRKLNAIRSMGAHIAVDDFGTGYSSLRYLAHLPIDALKIDRSFVSMMADEANNLAIVSSVIALAHSFDLDVIAEGVETIEQRKLLGLLRCDQMQGFLYSPAVDRNRIGELIVAESNAATHRNRTLFTGDQTDVLYPERRHHSARSRR